MRIIVCLQIEIAVITIAILNIHVYTQTCSHYFTENIWMNLYILSVKEGQNQSQIKGMLKLIP